jgi:hypothetical protein
LCLAKHTAGKPIPSRYFLSLKIITSLSPRFHDFQRSRGLTPQLSETGQMPIMVCIFLGRIEPLPLGFILVPPKKEGLSYTSADIQIG